MHRQDTGISIVARRFLSAFPAQIDQQVRKQPWSHLRQACAPRPVLANKP